MDSVPYRNASRLAAVAGRGRVLVDVGGGTGRVARRLSGFDRVVVADVERGMLVRARARGLAVVVADARHLPFRPGSADAVVAVDALHHFPDQERAITEAAGLLGPGGRLVIEEFDPSSLGGAVVRVFELALGFGSVFHRPADLQRLVARATGLATAEHRFSGREYAVVATRSGARRQPH